MFFWILYQWDYFHHFKFGLFTNFMPNFLLETKPSHASSSCSCRSYSHWANVSHHHPFCSSLTFCLPNAWNNFRFRIINEVGKMQQIIKRFGTSIPLNPSFLYHFITHLIRLLGHSELSFNMNESIDCEGRLHGVFKMIASSRINIYW